MIECPSCATQYNISLPSEGRTVRCAKCRHVWRAFPVAPETDDNPDEQTQPGATVDVPDKDTREREVAPPEPSFQSSRQEYAHEHDGSTVQQVIAAEAEAAAASEPIPDTPASTGFSRIGTAHTDEIAAESLGAFRPAVETRDNVRSFEPFRTASQNDLKDMSLAKSASSERSFSGAVSFGAGMAALGPADGPAADEIQTLEEARAAVRDVFSNLNDHRSSAGTNPYAEPVLQKGHDYVADAPPVAFASQGHASIEPAVAEDIQAGSGQEDATHFGTHQTADTEGSNISGRIAEEFRARARERWY